VLRSTRCIYRTKLVQYIQKKNKNLVGAGGRWDLTPLTRALTPYILAPTSHMRAPKPYYQAPTRPSTASRQMCNFAITRKLNRLNSQRAV